MKYKLLIFAFSFISLKSIGQDVPQVVTNTDLYDQKQSYVYNTFGDDYEILVSFTSDCYWPNKQEYYLVGKKNSQWESKKVVVEYNDRTKTADNIKRIKKKRLKTKKEELKNLFSSWTDNGFWTLDNDSLNVNEKQTGPDESIMLMITDGCTDTFEIIQGDSYRIMYSYLPDSFQKEIPVKQREQFIIARNEFLKIIKKNRG